MRPQQRSFFGGSEPPRDVQRFPSAPAGYAAPPGSGPRGETCGTCAHCRVRRIRGHDVYKCAQRERDWSHDRSTDVLVRSPACLKHKAGKPAPINAFGKPI